MPINVVTLNIAVDGNVQSSQEIQINPSDSIEFPFTLTISDEGDHLVTVSAGDSSSSREIIIIREEDDDEEDEGFDLTRFDENGNCLIDNQELFVAVDLWIVFQLGNQFFFAVVDAWIAQSNICDENTSTASGNSLRVRMSGHSLEVTAQISSVDAIELYVFDKSGNQINSIRSDGSSLNWNLHNSLNQPVANGTYFYQATLTLSGGKIIRFPIERVAVLR